MAKIKKQKLSVNFNDFSGGMVTNQFDSSLMQNEFTELTNVDYLVRGGFIKRFGYSDIIPTNQSLLDLGVLQADIDTWFTATNFDGIKQSITKIYAKKYIKEVGGNISNPKVSDDDYEIIVCAIDGKLVIMNYIPKEQLLHSDGNPTVYPGRIIYSGFQNTKVFKLGQGLTNNLIATPGDNILLGKLVYDESTGKTDFIVDKLNDLKKVPTVTEYSVLGGNTLADDLFNDITDQYSAQSMAVVNVRTKPNIGYVDNSTKLTAYVTSPTVDLTAYEFQWSVKKPGEDTFTVVSVWTADVAGKSLNYIPNTILKSDGSAVDNRLDFANYVFKVEMREIAVPTNISEQEITYRVTATNENRNENSSAIDLNKCIDFEVSDDRIKFFNNGTPLWYKSVIKDETYIPVNGIMNFDGVKTENVTGVVSYRMGKLVFTDTTIQLVIGKGDDIPDINGSYEPYLRRTVSTNLGCIAPNSIAVADDIIFFLSRNGIYGLDTLSVDQSRVQLKKVSDSVDNIAYRDTNAVGVVYKNKYYLFYPNRNYALKLDYTYGRLVTQTNIPIKPFTIDKSEKIDFQYALVIDDRLIGLSKSGYVLEQNTISLPSDTDINRLENIEFEKDFFTDDGLNYNQKIVSKNYDNFDLNSKDNQQAFDKRVKQVFVKSQNYSIEETKFYFELMTEFGKIVNTVSNEYSVQEIAGERQVVKTVTRTANVINRTGFELGVTGSAILGSTDLGFYENSISFINLYDSKVSKNFQFIFENDLDQPSVIISFGADYILYRKPRI